MKKRVLSLVLSAVMVSALLAGCGSSSSEGTTDSNTEGSGTGGEDAGAASGETVKLTVWASDEDQDLTNDLVSQFKEANPDQTFDITVGAQSEATAKDTILIDPEAAADVFSFASDQVTELVNAKVLQEVQDVDTISSENVESSVEAATAGDTLYAYPMSADNGFFMYYDSTIISADQAKTWDSLLAACQAAGKKVGMVMASGWYNAGFFYGAGFTTTLNDDGSTTMDWNKTSADGVKGMDVLQGMLDIAKNPAFLPITDGDTANQIASGQLGAIVSGTWDATAVQEAFGEGYAASVLPTFTCGGAQVPVASVAGYKMVGVNKNSAQVGWAMELAKFLTNEDSQKQRFEKREIGPSNKVVSESQEVQDNIAIATVTEQNNTCGVVQTVGSNYWDPTKSLGEIIAQGNPDGQDLQALLDNTVAAVTQPTAG